MTKMDTTSSEIPQKNHSNIFQIGQASFEPMCGKAMMLINANQCNVCKLRNAIASF